MAATIFHWALHPWAIYAVVALSLAFFFIARVSRGRTVREFVFCVMVIPTLVSIVWMGVFGGTAIAQVMSEAGGSLRDAALEIKLFEMLSHLPLAGITSFIGIVLVLVFFVTSSDSASLVIDTITAGGKTDAPTAQRVFWCLFEGLVAATLLLVGGDDALNALQAMSVSTGFPFAIVLLIMTFSLIVGLIRYRRRMAAR